MEEGCVDFHVLEPTDKVVHCEFQHGLWSEDPATFGQIDRPPTDLIVKTPAPSFVLCSSPPLPTELPALKFLG